MLLPLHALARVLSDIVPVNAAPMRSFPAADRLFASIATRIACRCFAGRLLRLALRGAVSAAVHATNTVVLHTAFPPHQPVHISKTFLLLQDASVMAYYLC